MDVKLTAVVEVAGKKGYHRFGKKNAVRISKEDAQKIALFPVDHIPRGCEAGVRAIRRPWGDKELVANLNLEHTDKGHWFLASQVIGREHWETSFKVKVTE